MICQVFGCKNEATGYVQQTVVYNGEPQCFVCQCCGSHSVEAKTIVSIDALNWQKEKDDIWRAAIDLIGFQREKDEIWKRIVD
jgi:hypothetical protein